MSADRNLLFGILAVQMAFISRDALLHAMNAWVREKHRPLADILRQHDALSAERAALLDSLVAEQLQIHGDARRSLSAVSPRDAIPPTLRQVADAEIQDTIAHLIIPPLRSPEELTESRAP